MLRLVSDENFNDHIVQGALRLRPDLDVVSVRDVGLQEAKDPVILAWAAAEGRLLLTHDRATVPDYAYDRVRAGEPMPGVFVVNDRLPVGKAIEQVLMVALCSSEGAWKDQVIFLPL